MAIDVTSPDLDPVFDDFISKQEKAILETLKYIGEKCEEEGKEGGSYQDRTGKLRASVRYRVINNGEIYAGSAPDENKGAEDGDELLDKLAFAYSLDGAVLVVVAGMRYAAAVEAKNFNVLTSAELLSDQLIPQLMGKLGYIK